MENVALIKPKRKRLSDSVPPKIFLLLLSLPRVSNLIQLSIKCSLTPAYGESRQGLGSMQILKPETSPQKCINSELRQDLMKSHQRALQ